MFMNVGLISERGIMNRFVQKLIAGAAAVAIAVTGLLGGAPVAKAADPAQPTDGTITIINNDSATYDHTFEGWRLATLKNVTVTGTGENASINFEIDTTDEFVNVIVEVMSEMTVDGKNVKTEYETDANYNGSVTGTEANPMGYLIDKVFKTGGNATVENTETLWKNSSTALREFATKLSAKTLTSSVADNHKTDFKSGNATTGANECKQGFWFLMDTTADPKGTVNANAIESQSIPMLLATKLVNPTDQDAPDYAGATANLGTVTLKANEPSINKEITKVNKADADSKTKMNARIGDTITYTLTTTIPDYTGYVDGSRVLQLIDTAAHGLKDVTVTKVKVGDTELNEDADADNNGYVLKQDKNQIDPLDNCNKADATVTTVDLAHYVNTNDNIASGATVTVTLTAVVDSDAVIAGVGNPNTVELAYSRTPSGEKHQVPGPTVRVYTYDFSIYKTNMAGDTALSGAQFAIARVDSNAETFMTQDAATKAWKNLTTAKPAADADEGVFTTSADGKIAMSGLPAGEYHVYEIKAPDGYTSIGLPDFKFTITPTFDTAGTTVTSVAYEKTTNTDGNRVSFGTGETASMAQIKNAKNLTELPMTGDLGIKVFVTVGVLLMAAGAAFALSARMRA